MDVEEMVRKNVYQCQSNVVEALMDKELLSFEDILNLENPDYPDEFREVYSWWSVADWLFYELKNEGCVVLDSKYGKWWGRTCYGQSIHLDGVIKRIAESIK